MAQKYTAVIKHAEWWIGWIEEVPGVNCQERTREELVETLKVTLAEARRGADLTESFRIRSANLTDASELLAIRRDAIMALAEEYGREAAERWATSARPDRAAKAIATNGVWVAEFSSEVVGWVEVGGATIEGLYVSPDAARRGVASALLTHAERQIRDTGASFAFLDASPNAEAFYARRGYKHVGKIKANNSIPMRKALDLSAV